MLSESSTIMMVLLMLLSVVLERLVEVVLGEDDVGAVRLRGARSRLAAGGAGARPRWRGRARLHALDDRGDAHALPDLEEGDRALQLLGLPGQVASGRRHLLRGRGVLLDHLVQ